MIPKSDTTQPAPMKKDTTSVAVPPATSAMPPAKEAGFLQMLGRVLPFFPSRRSAPSSKPTAAAAPKITVTPVPAVAALRTRRKHKRVKHVRSKAHARTHHRRRAHRARRSHAHPKAGGTGAHKVSARVRTVSASRPHTTAVDTALLQRLIAFFLPGKGKAGPRTRRATIPAAPLTKKNISSAVAALENAASAQVPPIPATAVSAGMPTPAPTPAPAIEAKPAPVAEPVFVQKPPVKDASATPPVVVAVPGLQKAAPQKQKQEDTPAATEKIGGGMKGLLRDVFTKPLFVPESAKPKERVAVKIEGIKKAKAEEKPVGPVVQEKIGGGMGGLIKDILTKPIVLPALSKKPVTVSAPGIKKVKESAESAPVVATEKIGGGMKGLLRDVFTKPLFVPESAKPAAKNAAPSAVAPALPAAPGERTDLDSLFTAPASEAAESLSKAKALKGRRKTPAEAAASAVQPALPSEDLMQKSETAVPADTGKRIQTEAAAPVLKQPAASAKTEKAPAPAKEKSKTEKAASTEVVYKSRPVYKNSAFKEFLGAIKFLGLGKERFAVIQNLATMLNAGLPLIDSLKTLQMETRVKPMKKMLGSIVELVENGSTLWRAMEDQHFFSPHAIALVRIGEEAGSLAENMEYLSAQQEKDQALKAKVKMAMIYPSIVLTMMFIIVIGLGMFVLPNLVGVLFSLNVPLPLVTRLVIQFTNFFTVHGTTAVPAMIAGFVVIALLLKFTPLKIVGQWMLFKIPGIGALARQATIARFGVILGGLLQAGVPLVEALKSMADVTPVVAYRRFYFHLLDHITVGDSFSKSFAILKGSEKLLPLSVQQLVITGEKSGSLANILLKIADIYEKKANNTAEKLPVILEPMILLIIGALVGTIAFAIIVPIYSIVGNVGG